MNIVFYRINESTFILIIKPIRAKLFPNHSKNISKMRNVNIQVFTSTDTPGVQLFVLFFQNVICTQKKLPY